MGFIERKHPASGKLVSKSRLQLVRGTDSALPYHHSTWTPCSNAGKWFPTLTP